MTENTENQGADEQAPAPVLQARNPVRVGDHTIDIEVAFDGENFQHFTADANDIYPYGVDLYHRAAAGEFGAEVPMPDKPKGSPPNAIG